jgi:hypothetical protein
MKKRFEMSMMSELKFFLGFQIKQVKEGTLSPKQKFNRLFLFDILIRPIFLLRTYTRLENYMGPCLSE